MKPILNFQFFHEKIRNFECSYCEKKFQAKKLLYNHVQSIHLGEKTKCPDCKKDISVDNFTRHVKEFHEKVNTHVKYPTIFYSLFRWRNPVLTVERNLVCQIFLATSVRCIITKALSVQIVEELWQYPTWINTSNLCIRNWRKPAIYVTKRFHIQVLGNIYSPMINPWT